MKNKFYQILMVKPVGDVVFFNRVHQNGISDRANQSSVYWKKDKRFEDDLKSAEGNFGVMGYKIRVIESEI